MRFSSEQERSQHLFARQISSGHWNSYFNNEWLPIYERLLQASSLEDCAILSLESHWDAKKLQSCLICILANNKAISLNFWQQFLQQLPHTLDDIFIFAAYFGHVNILSYLWNSYPQSQNDMIMADNFSAFRWAAANGHLAVLQQLKEWVPAEKLENMIAANNFLTFQTAAANGRVAVLEQLKEWVPNNKLQDMIAASHFLAFPSAAANGHLPVLNKLKEWAPNELQNMIKTDKFGAFQLAAKNGHLAVLEQLKQWAPTKLQDMIAANNFRAFRGAAANGQIAVLEQLQKWAPTELQNMIAASNFLAFQLAAKNGHVRILKQLQQWWPPNELQKMIAANDFLAFRLAAENGHFAVLEQFEKWTPNTLQDMSVIAFQGAAEYGHLAVLEQFRVCAPKELQQMIAANDFLPFRWAAKNGHVAVLKQLKQWLPEKLQEMIAANHFLAFQLAAQNGHIAVLEQLNKWAPGKLTDMLAANNFATLKILAKQKSALLKNLINTQEGVSLLLSVIDENTGQSALMKAIEDTLPLNGKELNPLEPLKIFALTYNSLKTLEQRVAQGNLQAQYLLVKWDTVAGQNLQKSVLDYRWLAANGHRGAFYDIKRYAEAGNPFFQCIYYSLEHYDRKLINLLVNNAEVRAFFFLTDFDFLHEAIVFDSHNDYILERLALLDKIEQKFPQNNNDKERQSELWAWVYCLRVLFAIQTRQQIEEKTWAHNPMQINLCNATTQKMIPLLVIHYNHYQNQWSNEQRQDFIRLLVNLSFKTDECILQPPVLRDFNRILVHHLCGKEFGITFISLTKEQQLTLITLASSGEKIDGDRLNETLDCALTYRVDQKGWDKFYCNFFTNLPALISDDKDEDYRDSCMHIESGI
jgi:hypothetical protein